MKILQFAWTSKDPRRAQLEADEAQATESPVTQIQLDKALEEADHWQKLYRKEHELHRETEYALDKMQSDIDAVPWWKLLLNWGSGR
jgi:hypothetical protein